MLLELERRAARCSTPSLALCGSFLAPRSRPGACEHSARRLSERTLPARSDCGPARSAALLLALLAPASQAWAQQACDVRFHVAPKYDAQPRHLAVVLAFNAAGRTSTELEVDDGWSGVDFSPHLSDWSASANVFNIEQAGKHILVRHGPSGEVRVAYRANASLADPDRELPQPLDDSYKTQLGSDWFQFFGYSVFPLVRLGPALADSRTTCVEVAQDSANRPPLLGSCFASGAGDGHCELVGRQEEVVLRAFFAGGMGWRVRTSRLSSGDVNVAMRGRFGFDEEEATAEAARLINAQREFWGEDASGFEWVVVTPNYTPSLLSGTLAPRSAVLHVGRSFAPGRPGFRFLVGHENLHQWIPRRFGPGRFDDGSAYWFSEGFAEFYTHRLLLQSGAWSRAELARQLTERLQRYWRSALRNAPLNKLAPQFFTNKDASDQMYTRGEFLAWRWMSALTRVGTSLDATLRGLLLPAGADLRGMPLATDRVISAVDALLPGTARSDVERFYYRGEDIELAEDLFGACFAVTWVPESGDRAASPDQSRLMPIVRETGAARSECF